MCELQKQLQTDPYQTWSQKTRAFDTVRSVSLVSLTLVVLCKFALRSAFVCEPSCSFFAKQFFGVSRAHEEIINGGPS